MIELRTAEVTKAPDLRVGTPAPDRGRVEAHRVFTRADQDGLRWLLQVNPPSVRRRLTDSRRSFASYRYSLSGRKGKRRTALPSTPTTHVSLAEPIHLPPPFTLVRLREGGDAFAHACRIAPESGAGTLVHVGRFDLAEFAVVLEPGEPLSSARRAFYAGMVALTDALRA